MRTKLPIFLASLIIISCVFARAGEAAGPRRWTSAFLIPLGDSGSRFLLANDSGDIILADLTPQGYSEVSRAHLLEPTNTDARRRALWSHPAFAGGVSSGGMTRRLCARR